MKEKIRNYIEENKDELIKTVQEVVQIETVSGNEMAGQQYKKKKYEELGLDIHEFERNYEKMKAHEAFVDSGFPYEGRKNLIGIHRGLIGRISLLIHGMQDVVPHTPV